MPSFPKLSETFVVNQFLGLLEKGWDAHAVCEASDQAEVALFPELRQRIGLMRRVHVRWSHRPRWMAGLLLPLALLRCFIYDPAATWGYLRRGWKKFGLDVFRRCYLDAELIILKPALVHFEFGALAVDQMNLKSLLGCKVVVSFRGYDLNYVGLGTQDYYKSVWENADAIHLLGSDLWRRAQSRGCPPEKKHALIPPATDVVTFDPGDRLHTEEAGGGERPLRILSVGRLDWRKGYEYGLQAVRLLSDLGIQSEYRITGDGEYLEAVAFARHKFGLEGNTRLLGAQPPRSVKAHMQWADVFLHAAVSEGFCNAVIEAQAMALPVVCTDAGGLPENVADGETGFVVPRRDPQMLAEKLALLARNPDLRQRMGQAGRQRVITHFQLKDQIAAFDRLFRQVLPLEGKVEEDHLDRISGAVHRVLNKTQ